MKKKTQIQPKNIEIWYRTSVSFSQLIREIEVGKSTNDCIWTRREGIFEGDPDTWRREHKRGTFDIAFQTEAEALQHIRQAALRNIGKAKLLEEQGLKQLAVVEGGGIKVQRIKPFTKLPLGTEIEV